MSYVTYVCAYEFAGQTRFVSHVDPGYFKGGFWVGAGHTLTETPQNVYWIPAGRVLYIERVVSGG